MGASSFRTLSFEGVNAAFDLPTISMAVEVHLRQIQFLCHQSKIPSKIELFTAQTGKDGSASKYSAAKFTRLGYAVLVMI